MALNDKETSNDSVEKKPSLTPTDSGDGEATDGSVEPSGIGAYDDANPPEEESPYLLDDSSSPKDLAEEWLTTHEDCPSRYGFGFCHTCHKMYMAVVMASDRSDFEEEAFLDALWCTGLGYLVCTAPYQMVVVKSKFADYINDVHWENMNVMNVHVATLLSKLVACCIICSHPSYEPNYMLLLAYINSLHMTMASHGMKCFQIQYTDHFSVIFPPPPRSGCAPQEIFFALGAAMQSMRQRQVPTFQTFIGGFPC